MTRKIFVYWRDIPAQVIVQRGRVREKGMLSTRFQEAIDRAAMRAGKGGSDAYIAEWRRETEPLDSGADIKAVVAAELARIEAEFTDDALDALARNHGIARV